jgi:hypothetical protein
MAAALGSTALGEAYVSHVDQSAHRTQDRIATGVGALAQRDDGDVLPTTSQNSKNEQAVCVQEVEIYGRI